MSLWAPTKQYSRLSGDDGEKIKVCNCAECGQLLLGADHIEVYNRLNGNARKTLPPLVADWFTVRMTGPDGRTLWHRRPWCSKCVEESLREQQVELTERQRRDAEYREAKVASLGTID